MTEERWEDVPDPVLNDTLHNLLQLLLFGFGKLPPPQERQSEENQYQNENHSYYCESVFATKPGEAKKTKSGKIEGEPEEDTSWKSLQEIAADVPGEVGVENLYRQGIQQLNEGGCSRMRKEKRQREKRKRRQKRKHKAKKEIKKKKK